MVGERFDVALDAEVEQEGGGRERPSSQYSAVYWRSCSGEEFLFGVGVVGVLDHEISRAVTVDGVEDEAVALSARDLRHFVVRLECNAEFAREVRDAVNDAAEPPSG